jgi:hypothetical protein
MKKIKQLVLVVLGVAGISSSALLAPTVGAINVFDQCAANAESAVCKAQATDGTGTSMIGDVIDLLLYILGIISVIMIVIGGIRYATSNGDPGSTKSAKDTVLYAVIGLIVAILAFSIVNFVLGSF